MMILFHKRYIVYVTLKNAININCNFVGEFHEYECLKVRFRQSFECDFEILRYQGLKLRYLLMNGDIWKLFVLPNVFECK